MHVALESLYVHMTIDCLNHLLVYLCFLFLRCSFSLFPVWWYFPKSEISSLILRPSLICIHQKFSVWRYSTILALWWLLTTQRSVSYAQMTECHFSCFTAYYKTRTSFHMVRKKIDPGEFFIHLNRWDVCMWCHMEKWAERFLLGA